MDQQFHQPDPVTGFLLRQSRCFPWTKKSKRWDRHKVVFDGELLSTYRVPKSKRVDSVQASDILNVEGLLLVSSSVPVVPPGARAEAPAGEPTPAGFLVNIRGGQEILFCASNEKDRARWIEGFSPQAQARRRSQSALGIIPPEDDSTDKLTDDQENLYGTLAPMNPLVKTGCGAGEDKGKGQNLGPPVPPGNGSTDNKGKGKGPPLPPGKGATESKGKHKGPPLPPGKGVNDKGKSKGPPLPSKGPPLPEGKMGPNKGGNGKGPPPPKAKGKGAGKGPPLGSQGKAGRGKGKGSKGPKDSLETDAPKAPKVHGLQEKKLSDAEGTIFAAPRPARTLNFEALEPAAKPAPGKRWVPPSERAGKSGKGSGKAEVKVFDTAIAFRISVATDRMDLETLAEAAASMDINKGVFKEKLDSADIFCTLLNELKFADPLGQLRAFVLRGGSVESLREVERRVLKLSLVPRAMQRLRLLMMAATLQERTNNLRKQMNCLLTTAEGIQASAHLRDVVHVMQEFMAWNSGGTSTSEAPKAFHIGELLGKLKEIRTSGMAKNRNLIHWIIETLQEWERPIAADQLQSEVPSLAVAAKTNPVHMNEEMKAITECRQLAKNELKEHRDDYLVGSIPLPSPAPPPAPKSPVRPKGHEAQASLEETPDVPQNAPSDLDAKETAVEVVEAVTEDKEETKPPEVAPTVFFSLDESVEGRPTILPKDRFKVPVPTSAWDVSLLPTEVHVPRLELYKAGTFAHVVPQATGNFGSSIRGSMSSNGPLSRGAMWRQGFVWILRPTRKRRPEWVRCWADIRAHHLIIRYLRRKGAVRSESIIALPGAEIKPFHYLTATSIGQWLAKLKFHGFEIMPNYAHDKEPILIHVGNEDSAEHWFDELSRESALCGVGTLRRDAKKEVLWCTLDLEEKKLFCHADTVQFILGKPPKYEHDVGAATIRSFSDPDALLSKVAQKYKIGHPFGFEIEEEDWMSSQCSFFTTETSRDLDRWLSVLQAAPQSILTRLDGGHSFGMALPPVGEVDGDDAGLGSLLAGGAARPSFGIAFSRSVNDKTQILPIRSTNEEPEMMELNEDILPEGGDRSLMPQVPRPGRESRVSRVSMAVRDIPNILGGKDSDSDDDNHASFASAHVPAEEAEDGYATPDDEPETLGNLRRLARSLEAETAKLQNEVKAAECCAQLALAFFDETREGPSLESLHHLFVQLDQFAGEFKSAFATLRAAAARSRTTSRKTCRRSTL